MKKRKILKSILVISMAMFVGISAVGCGKTETAKNEDAPKVIRIGGTPISQVTYEAIKPLYEKEGYKTEFVMFDSNPVALQACNDGDVDIDLGQHIKFAESFNKTKNGDLEMVKPYGYYTGIGLYSEKYKSVDEIPEGGKIAIMNDPINMGIALSILQDSGLIKLNPDVETPTIADITENKKSLKIIDMEQAQTVAALKDMDASCVFFTHMSNAKKDPAKFLARDKVMINFPMGVIVKKENAEKKWVIDFAKLLRNKDVQKKIDDKYPSVFEFYTSDDQVKK